MTLSEELTWRGLANQTTLTDISILDKDPITFYFGVDPSAESMHIGQLAMAMMIRYFMSHGHKAVLLVGGATGMIGDPDGKADERELKSVEEIERNKTGIVEQYRALFEGYDFEIVDNYDWFQSINYLTFLRGVGKHVPLSQMLGRDFIQARLGEGGSGISYAEFSYALIQGYDFLHLYKEKGVTLQIAGADQWGNSVTGVQLIRRLENADAHVWTAPLIINKTTGRKFGKTEDGAVWLNNELTSPYKFYQFWLNVDDEGAVDYLKIYTLLAQGEIEELATLQRQNPGARDAQKRLAYEVTKLVHGAERADSIVRVTRVLFGGEAFEGLTNEDVAILSDELPSVAVGKTAVEAMVATGAAASNGEARRLILGGAVTMNGVKLQDDQVLDAPGLLKKGKNTFILCK